MSNLITELEDLGKALATNLTNKGVTASYTDGLTTLANKVLTIPQGSGGHCYGVVFDSTSTIGVQGTATVGVTLYDNYAVLPNTSITLTGNDNSTYTATTNSQGYVTFTTSGTSGTTISYSITYQGVTKNCSVTYISHLFYDECNSASGLSNYGSPLVVRGSGTATLGYNSNGYYTGTITGTSAYQTMYPITSLTGTTNFKFSIELQPSSGTNVSCGMVIRNDANNYHSYFTTYQNKFYENYKKNGSETETNLGSLTVMNIWQRYEFIVNSTNNTITVNIYNVDTDALVATYSRTLQITIDSNTEIGITQGWQTNNVVYIRNIVVDPI